MIFYTSDTHFCHKNIISLNNRPFKDIDDMNESLILNWNKKVQKNDIVYILGDVGFPKNKQDVQNIINIIKRLNGKKYLVAGNHDWKLIKEPEFVKEFEKIEPYIEISDCERKVVMFHYPIEEWNGFYRESIHLYGHVHNNENNLANIKNRYNVGVDVNNYEPVTLKELLDKNN